MMVTYRFGNNVAGGLDTTMVMLFCSGDWSDLLHAARSFLVIFLFRSEERRVGKECSW